MKSFVARFGSSILSVLTGFDRLVFRGHLQPLIRRSGMFFFLEDAGVRLLDFKDYVQRTTEQVKEASLAEARNFDRPIEFLESPRIDKEDKAREILRDRPVDNGLVCAFKALEPCMSFEYHRSPNREERGLRLRSGKCLHIYKYYFHPRFGFMSARIQTWFPFNIQICLNGREWLACLLQRKGSAFMRADNCFTWFEDPALAHRLMKHQLTTDWPWALDAIARKLNPLHSKIFELSPMDYYWSAYQTEWATDVMFRNPKELASIYPNLVRHAVDHFKSPGVMRFLCAKEPNGDFTGEIVTSFKDRVEGVRVKHWIKGNSVKMYDKAGSVLRVETTIAQPEEFKVFRPHHDDPNGPLDWRQLRKGVADLHRRAQVSQRSNDAYLDALATVADTTPCSEVFDAVSRPVTDGRRRVRALRLGDRDDLALLEAVSRGEFAVSGFRNRDIRSLIHRIPKNASPQDLRRLSAKVSRQFRLLRAHGLIRKVQKSHR